MSDIEFDRNLVVTLGRNARESYPERSWEEIEPVLRGIWEFDRKLRDWGEVRAAVQAAWHSGDSLAVPARGGRASSRHVTNARAA